MIKINKNCLDLIKHFESFMAHPYQGKEDAPGVITIGYGTIKYPSNYLNGKKVELSDAVITEAQAEGFLLDYINRILPNIDSFLRDDLSENQFGSLTSFAYNLGEGALRMSTLLKKVNTNPKDNTVRDEFLRWVHSSTGKRLEGLVIRRKAEADLYFTV